MEHLGQFILNHWQLWLALVILLILVFINEAREQRKKANDLSPQAVVDKINHDNATVIDLRDKEAFKKGHIIGAVNASLDSFEGNSMNKYKDKPIVLVCDRGLQSSTTAAKIQAKGFTQVMTLNGGMANWQSAQFPVVKGKG